MTLKQTLSDTTRTLEQTAFTVGGVARQTFFAGLGVLATLQHEAEKVFQQLVREGRAVEAGRGRTLTAEIVPAAEAEVEQAVAEAVAEAKTAGRKADLTAKALEERIAETVTQVLQRMNVPTRDDVEALRKSVERLDRKTAALRAS